MPLGVAWWWCGNNTAQVKGLQGSDRPGAVARDRTCRRGLEAWPDLYT